MFFFLYRSLALQPLPFFEPLLLAGSPVARRRSSSSSLKSSPRLKSCSRASHRPVPRNRNQLKSGCIGYNAKRNKGKPSQRLPSFLPRLHHSLGASRRSSFFRRFVFPHPGKQLGHTFLFLLLPQIVENALKHFFFSLAAWNLAVRTNFVPLWSEDVEDVALCIKVKFPNLLAVERAVVVLVGQVNQTDCFGSIISFEVEATLAKVSVQ
mmetsp:Transcript_21376/g.43368  ORF Transcript_21376/g.43368 Transcript_21376/m.43368 type:complete len:209 (+) Transcript_21376:378-1004(+)